MGPRGSLANAFQSAINNPYLDQSSYQRQIEEMMRYQQMAQQSPYVSQSLAKYDELEDNPVLLLLTK